MSFLGGLALGALLGVAAGARYAGAGLQNEATQIWRLLPEEVRGVGMRTQFDLLGRLRRAEDVYRSTLESTREQLERDLESARSARR